MNLSKAHVVNIDGLDVTDAFIKGAQEILKLARLVKTDKAILKAKSPSCGCGFIHDGSFIDRLIQGNGVTVQFLLDDSIEVKPI